MNEFRLATRILNCRFSCALPSSGVDRPLNFETTDLGQALRVVETTAVTLPLEREVYTVDKPDITLKNDRCSLPTPWGLEMHWLT